MSPARQPKITPTGGGRLTPVRASLRSSVLVTEPSAAEPAPPLMVAEGLLATGPRGRVFGPIAVRVAAGELLAVTGPGGSGRTALLLALSGRLRVAGGRLIVGGHPLDIESGAIRSLVAVARAGDTVDLDELWTVGEAIANRAVLTRRGPAGAVESAVRARLTGAGVDVLRPPRCTRSRRWRARSWISRWPPPRTGRSSCSTTPTAASGPRTSAASGKRCGPWRTRVARSSP